MLNVDTQGFVLNARVKRTPRPQIERGILSRISGIIVHQTASLFRQTWHAGRLRARCLAELRCSPAELKALKKFDPRREHRMEMEKRVPQRYPSNEDSIGIEIVGAVLAGRGQNPAEEGVYESVNVQQNAALRWLISELTVTYGIPMTEIFRHPVVSRKNPTEAESALW